MFLSCKTVYMHRASNRILKTCLMTESCIQTIATRLISHTTEISPSEILRRLDNKACFLASLGLHTLFLLVSVGEPSSLNCLFRLFLILHLTFPPDIIIVITTPGTHKGKENTQKTYNDTVSFESVLSICSCFFFY